MWPPHSLFPSFSFLLLFNKLGRKIKTKMQDTTGLGQFLYSELSIIFSSVNIIPPIIPGLVSVLHSLVWPHDPPWFLLFLNSYYTWSQFTLILELNSSLSLFHPPSVLSPHLAREVDRNWECLSFCIIQGILLSTLQVHDISLYNVHPTGDAGQLCKSTRLWDTETKHSLRLLSTMMYHWE